MTPRVLSVQGGYLYEKNLTATIKAMAAAKQFKQMVIYIEACESVRATW
eukprot:SAG11_NODE_34418_length_272_cov_0.595376_1_plen_48_part_01